ncbi:YSC84-related protein [Flavobacterium jejuense]|uniref:YSC84-related protein n=1 Tax=Flavobacterium jejuense TaxID=1544455 RepID=UPI00374275E3
MTAGPVGRNLSGHTDYKLDAEIYSYSRSKGVFAGISINGSNLAIDKSSNENFMAKTLLHKPYLIIQKVETKLSKI